MKIVNVKREQPEMEMPRAADYSYGLCLHLCGETLEKLGITAMPPIGGTVQIAGQAVVVALRDDGDMRSMELQITDLGVSKAAKSPAGKLYPSAVDD